MIVQNVEISSDIVNFKILYILYYTLTYPKKQRMFKFLSIEAAGIGNKTAIYWKNYLQSSKIPKTFPNIIVKIE